MEDLRLVLINENGMIDEADVLLPEAAREVCNSFIPLYRNEGFIPPWTGYLAFYKDKCVGTCAFKYPVRDNRVEIAYFTFPEFENMGYATLMAQRLIRIAEETEPGVCITAQTLPEENKSNNILIKLGFRFAGRVMHPEDGQVWEWILYT